MKDLVWWVFQCMVIVGVREINIFFCLLFVYNLIICNTCPTNKCVWCRL